MPHERPLGNEIKVPTDTVTATYFVNWTKTEGGYTKVQQLCLLFEWQKANGLMKPKHHSSITTVLRWVQMNKNHTFLPLCAQAVLLHSFLYPQQCAVSVEFSTGYWLSGPPLWPSLHYRLFIVAWLISGNTRSHLHLFYWWALLRWPKLTCPVHNRTQLLLVFVCVCVCICAHVETVRIACLH